MIKWIINRDDINEFRSYATINREDGSKLCEYLELAWQANQPDRSCIPGNIDYLADLLWSEHHKGPRYCYRNVDGRTWCEIHSANIPAQLRGCGAPGLKRAAMMVVPSPEGGDYPAQDGVESSREALLEFMTACGIPDFLSLNTPEKVAEFVKDNPDLCTIAIRLNDPV